MSSLDVAREWQEGINGKLQRENEESEGSEIKGNHHHNDDDGNNEEQIV